MRPIWKWVIGILTLIVVTLVGSSWYLSRNWKPIVEQQLKELVLHSTDSLYHLTYKDLAWNIALGNVTLKDVVLQVDTPLYKRLEAAERAPDNLYHVHIKTLKVKRLELLGMLRNRALNIRSIVLSDPVVQLTKTYHAYNDTLAVEKPKKTLYESIQSALQSLHVARIDLANATFRYRENRQDASTDFRLDSIQLHIENVLIAEGAEADTSRLYYSKRIEAFIPGFEYHFSDGFYKIQFDALRVNTQEKSLSFAKLRYQPLMDKAAFYKKQGKNTTRFDLSFDSLSLNQLDFKRLLEKQEVFAARASVKNGYARLYDDKRYPKKPANQIGQAPHQKLLRLKAGVRLDSIFVKNVDVQYSEMSSRYGRAGEISFNAVTGVFSNVTNDSLRLRDQPIIGADLHAKVMDRGPLQVKFNFDMLSKEGAYNYSGILGAMNATAFNPMLYPLLNVEIRSGNIRGIRFHVSDTDHRSQGEFRFDYDNLKVELYADPDRPRKRSSLKIVSFLVNHIIINDSNPDANEKYHIGRINRPRVPEHGFFKNLWESLFDGIKQTAGISKEREEKWNEQATAAKEASQQTKGFFRRLLKKNEE